MRRIVVLCLAIGTACGREPPNDEFSAGPGADTVSVFGSDGSPRIFVADQDSSGTRLCFESDLNFPSGTPVTVVHSAFPQYATSGRLGKRTRSPCFPPPRASRDSMEYSVDAPEDTIGRRGVPVVILGKVPTAKTNCTPREYEPDSVANKR